MIADRVVNWQTIVGGWVKTGDYTRNRVPADDRKDAWSAGAFDNDSTIQELRFAGRDNAPHCPRVLIDVRGGCGAIDLPRNRFGKVHDTL